MSDPAKNTWPVLLLHDAAGVLGLLRAVGFRETVMMETDGVVEHGELAWPEGGGVMLGSANRANSSFSRIEHGPGLVYVVTDDPDAVFARATGHGAEVVMPLTDQDYGSREFSIRDVDGNVWSFGTYRGAPPD